MSIFNHHNSKEPLRPGSSDKRMWRVCVSFQVQVPKEQKFNYQKKKKLTLKKLGY